MKVLTFAHVFPRHKEDTVAPFLWNFHDALISQGITPIVLAPHEEGLLLKEKYSSGYTVHRFRYAPNSLERIAYKGEMHELVFQNILNKLIFMLFLLSATFSLFRMILKEKPDLIHVHWWVPLGLVTRFVCLFTRTPYVVTTHGTDVFILSRFKFLKPFAKSVFKHAQRVHVISSYVGSLVEELIPQKREAIDRISMPIRETDFKEVRPSYDKKRACKLLGIGRLIERKGFSTLLQSLTHIDTNYTLTIIGSGSLREALEQEATQLGVEKQVTFIEGVAPSKLPQVIEEHGIFILPSITDWCVARKLPPNRSS